MNATLTKTHAAAADYSLVLLAFVYLQVLDTLTTWLGFRLGLSEASPFIQLLMHWGPLAGLLASKVIAFALGAFCVSRGRFHAIRMINYWYGGLVVWNLSLILTR